MLGDTDKEHVDEGETEEEENDDVGRLWKQNFPQFLQHSPGLRSVRWNSLWGSGKS